MRWPSPIQLAALALSALAGALLAVGEPFPAAGLILLAAFILPED